MRALRGTLDGLRLALLAAGADREYFADRTRLERLAEELTTSLRSVAVQDDEEHSRYQLTIDDRSSGYPRKDTISVEFLSTGEYRTSMYRTPSAWLSRASS